MRPSEFHQLTSESRSLLAALRDHYDHILHEVREE